MVAPSPIALTSAGLEDGRDLLLHLDLTPVVDWPEASISQTSS